MTAPAPKEFATAGSVGGAGREGAVRGVSWRRFGARLLGVLALPVHPVGAAGRGGAGGGDVGWFRDRLADQDLLRQAVEVRVGGPSLLAVPVGGRRRGGYLPVSRGVDVLRVWAALRGRRGFPRARIRWSLHRDTCHTVQWGARPPDDDAARGLFYGYAPAVVAAFVLRHDPPPQHLSAGAPGQGRSWSQDPLLSTVRDVGGCLGVVLMAVAISVLVAALPFSAAHGAPTSCPEGNRRGTAR